MAIRLSINLTAFVHIREKRKNRAGELVDCIVIPCDANHLKFTDKGNLYVNATAWPRKNAPQNENDKSTHIINHDPGKDVRDSLKADGKYPATLGNAYVDSDEVQHTAPTSDNSYSAPASHTDDLPF